MTNEIKKNVCLGCGIEVNSEELARTLKVCPKCNYHFPVGADERIKILIDEGTFIEYDADMESSNPLNFPEYDDKLAKDKKLTGLKEAVITGEGLICGFPTTIGVTDYRFRMGSMASVFGEKITRCAESAIEKRFPMIIVSSSGGGARMQEGLISLMQMAKTSAACMRLRKEGLLYVDVLSYQSFAGVMASFATLGHIIIAEPGTKVGFTGERGRASVKQDLPKGFQTAEFMLERGMLDVVVQRKDLKITLADLLDFFS
jgi:acetyl-CoA carboxylase carboxyl transferase subunit beta